MSMKQTLENCNIFNCNLNQKTIIWKDMSVRVNLLIYENFTDACQITRGVSLLIIYGRNYIGLFAGTSDNNYYGYCCVSPVTTLYRTGI